MEKRKAAVEETRRRIVEAKLALHSEKDMFDTSWKDIAERADVSVATVYKHFPSLDELVPACGALIMAITAPLRWRTLQGSLATQGHPRSGLDV
jgi:AcrR family transcriptional regulator